MLTPDGGKRNDVDDPQSDEKEAGDEEVGEEATHPFNLHVHQVAVRCQDEQRAAR
jgi:hypothetical protein